MKRQESNDESINEDFEENYEEDLFPKRFEGLETLSIEMLDQRHPTSFSKNWRSVWSSRSHCDHHQLRRTYPTHKYQ